MIDALFGSKTRVKLLHLFLNNPGKAFYVREITRLIDEQINSVRRELSNMLEVGIIMSKSTDNKLYYEINQRYEFYVPFRAIFADQKIKSGTKERTSSQEAPSFVENLKNLAGGRVVLIAGVLVDGSASKVDVLVAGDVSPQKLKELITAIEVSEGRDINYSLLSYDDFYYRLSVRDRFITDILMNRHTVIVDVDNILK